MRSGTFSYDGRSEDLSAALIGGAICVVSDADIWELEEQLCRQDERLSELERRPGLNRFNGSNPLASARRGYASRKKAEVRRVRQG